MAYIKTIGKGKNKKFKAIVEIGKDPATGKRVRKTKTSKSKKEVEVWMANMITEREEGTMVDPSKITVGEFLDRWLENHKKPKIASTTYDGYKNRIEAHLKPALGAIPIQDLQPYHIESYFAQKRLSGRKDGEKGGLSENTLKKHYVLLNSAMKRAIKLKLIKYNPVQAVESPQPEKKEAIAMSRKEFYKLIEVAKEEDPWMFTFILVTLFTGMRRSEVLGLEWSEINFEKGIIEVKKRLVTKIGEGAVHEDKTKTNKSRRAIKISNQIVTLLKKHKKVQLETRLQLRDEYNDKKNFVFAKPDGTKYYPGTINKRLNKLLEKANLSQEYGIHTLRHTFATINLKNGVPAKIIQEMLGHSTIATTLDIYSHIDVEMQKTAVDKLDRVINIE